jgi:hypothetical protein
MVGRKLGMPGQRKELYEEKGDLEKALRERNVAEGAEEGGRGGGARKGVRDMFASMKKLATVRPADAPPAGAEEEEADTELLRAREDLRRERVEAGERIEFLVGENERLRGENEGLRRRNAKLEEAAAERGGGGIN